MIRVTPAPEPAQFNEKVRQPGLALIARLAAEAGSEEAIEPNQLTDYWREALDDLLVGYNHICAYLSVYISRATGEASVDHMVPKSKTLDLVYEWSNYRLACRLMNSRKGVAEVLDPFEIGEGWFALELVAFQVMPGRGLSAGVRARVVDTIETLGLSDSDCRKLRAEYAHDYWEGKIKLSYLREHAPFVARELERQGRLTSFAGAPSEPTRGEDERA